MVPRQGILTTTERRSDRIEHTTIFCPMPPEVLRRSLCEKSFHIKEKAAPERGRHYFLFLSELKLRHELQNASRNRGSLEVAIRTVGLGYGIQDVPKDARSSAVDGVREVRMIEHVIRCRSDRERHLFPDVEVLE